MQEQPRKPISSATENLWQRLAFGGQKGNSSYSRRAGGPGSPPSLTQQFNAAAKKPVLASDLSASPAKASEMLRLMRENARSMTQTTAPRPASLKQIEALKKKLSQPRLTHDRTPLGTVTSSYDPRRDRKLMQAIKEMQAQLKSHQGKAMGDFNRAAGLGK